MLSKLHILIFKKKNVGASYPYDMFFAYTDGIMRPNDLEMVTNDSRIILHKNFNL
jgi:hypothetical protein